MIRPPVCPVNRCGRPYGLGTFLTLTGHGRASDRTVRVCEQHWEAIRTILPLPYVTDGLGA